MRGLCRLAIQQLERTAFIAVGLVVTTALFVGTSSSRASAQPRETHLPATRQAALESFGGLPMSFEANVGQADGRARFVARGTRYAVALSGAGAAVALGAAGESDVLRIALAGADPLARPVAEQRLPGTTNYLVGSDETQWRRGVESYGAVRYVGVYRGVDAVYYGTQSQLEYDLVVAPGADAAQIRLRFEGQRRLSIDQAGELVLELPDGELRQQRARVYQDLRGGRRFVASRYAVDPDGSVRIVLGEYDRTRPLVVDPVVVYADYIGGSFGEVGQGVDVDASGAAYVAGMTNSPDFPTTPGAYDTVYQGAQGRNEAFVAKISPDGTTLVYSTFLGTTDSTQAFGLAVDGSGSAYVAGTTGVNYPTTPGAFDRTSGQCFVTKLSADGSSLVYSTFLNAIWIRAIAVDAAGSAYVTGSAPPTGFPTTPGAFDTTSNGFADAFVTKFAPDGGSLAYSTLLGGTGEDEGFSIALDQSGNAYVAGTALSANFPVSMGAFDTTYNGTDSGNVPYGDAFVTKVNATGATLGFSTYLGGSDEDVAFGIAVDAEGHPVVAGRTESTGFPTTPGAFDTTYNPGDGQPGNGPGDAFVTKLGSDGGTLAFSTYLGSSRSDTARAVALDPDGTVYVVGETYGSDFPVTPGAPPIPEQPSGGIESRDTFITRLAADAVSLLYSTIFGESGDDDTANAIAIDAEGAIYLTGYEGINTTLPSGFGVPGGGAYVMKLQLNAAVGSDTVGVYLPASSAFFLRNSNSPGAADLVFNYGPTGLGWVAIRGDWNGDGADTAALYDPSTGFFFLKNSQGPGGADLVFSFGAARRSISSPAVTVSLSSPTRLRASAPPSATARWARSRP
jgi:hypothetical protein